MRNIRAAVAALLQLAGWASLAVGLYLTVGLGATLIIVGVVSVALGVLVEVTDRADARAAVKGGEDGAGLDAPAGGTASPAASSNDPQHFDRYGPIDNPDDNY